MDDTHATAMASHGQPPRLPYHSFHGANVRDTMGRSFRTDRYPFTERKREGLEVLAEELCDHQDDPGKTVNLAASEDRKPQLADLPALLHAGRQAPVVESNRP